MFATILFKVSLSSCFLSRNLKIKIYKITILPVILYGCETITVYRSCSKHILAYTQEVKWDPDKKRVEK